MLSVRGDSFLCHDNPSLLYCPVVSLLLLLLHTDSNSKGKKKKEMEGGGLGSRQSRASSRYASGGPSSSAAAFNGPVRKWKKQWVSSYGSGSATATTNGGNNNNSRNTTAHRLYLCRWTPLSADDEPPKRRFRYAPIVPIKKGSTGTLDKVGKEARTGVTNHQSRSGEDTGDDDGMFQKPNTGDIFSEESQEFGEDQADSNRSFNQALS